MMSNSLFPYHRKNLRPAMLGCTFLAGLGLTLAASAQAETLVTGPSPFSTCTADNVASQPGTNYPNAEVEPWVDVKPKNSKYLIAGWQQDRWSNGGSRGLVSAYSTNGGATWTTVVPQGISLCTGGIYERATDPWVAISPNGTAYFMSLGFQNDEPCGAGGDNAMLVSRSTDGGATWSAPISLVTDTDGQLFNDKNSITADPVSNDHVYAVWDKLVDFNLPSSCTTRSAKVAAVNKGADGVADARDRLRKKRAGKAITPGTAFTGPTYFTRTTSGGLSWEPEKMIFDPGRNAQTINNLIEVLPNGTVIDFFTHILDSADTAYLGMVKSTDRGAHFGPLQTAFEMIVTNSGTLTPDAREPVRDANILFDVAVDSGNGNIYVVWQDGRNVDGHGNVDRVAFSMSTNGGNSWSPAVIINKTPDANNKLLEQAFVPSVEVGANHKVVVTYYDFRNDTNDGRELTDYWAISCDIAAGANCRAVSGWGGEQRLTSSSFDMLDAPVARGHFLGDYQGLVKAGSSVKAVFGKAVSDNVNDMFLSTIP